MRKREIHIQFTEHTSPDKLDPVQAMLLERAEESARNAYAPYSGFSVGAALYLENGEILTGSNQENAAFPSGMCAERVALFHAASVFPDIPVRKLALSARRSGKPPGEPVTPCGGCLQVMCETEHRGGVPMELILHGSKRILVIARATDLLPFPFNLP